MFLMKNLDDLWEHIAYVLGYAPNFPREDFLADNEQMTLDLAFSQLREGIDLAYPGTEHESYKQSLRELLGRSYEKYKIGKDIEAGHLLNEFESKVFKVDRK